jgi:Sulfotransferase domain
MRQPQSKPNFFIVGAPKCGTTALSEYLREHPQVFFSHRKELHYFAINLPNYRRVTQESDYLQFFSGASPQHRALGEGSVYYLYSGQALEKIREFNPAAKIIVMLRNPIDLVYSLHGQLLYSCNEDERDFPTAWALQEDRARGHRVPATCRDPKVLMYRDVGRLGSQCERLLDIFPTTQVKFLLTDDFRIRTPEVYREVLDFLGVEPDGRLRFERVNESKTYRIPALGKFTQRPPAPLVRVARQCTRWLHISRLGVLPRLRELNSRPHTKPPLDHTFRAMLAEEFREDTRKLANLIGRQDLWES